MITSQVFYGEKSNNHKKEVKEYARQNLYFFAKEILGYDLQDFHREWCEALQRYPRILLLSPRGSYKSTVISIAYPLWLLTNDNNFRVFIRSGTDTLAKSFLREIKGHIEHNEKFQYLFGKWQTETKHWQETSIIIPRSKYMKEVSIAVAGIGTSAVSQHYDVIIDDDIVNRQNVESSEQREKVVQAYKDDFGLLAPNGQNVVVGTRWHNQDIYGKLLENQDYKRILFKAHKEDGSLLFPKVLSEEFLEGRKKDMGSALYLSQYENNPQALQGMMFKRQWFEIVEQAPAGIQKVRYWDLAATEMGKNVNPDWTAGALLGEKDGIYYICNMQRIRGTPLEVENLVKQTAMLDTTAITIYQEQEPGASGKSAVDHYRREVLNGFDFHEDKKASSKELRARPVSAAAEAGNVKLVKGSWNSDFLDEIEAFPEGDHDDQVDAVSGAFEKLSFEDMAITNKPKGW
jgi:predicted phage terminase large subunit-like protein